MKIVFMGTPEFAVAPLTALLDKGYDVVGVVTVPDRLAGRGRQLTKSAVKNCIEEYNEVNNKNITLLQPEKLRDEEFLTQLKGLDADLFIVVAFRMLPQVVWDMPKLGTFNLHASLLPHYRGAAPINWAIINGETRTGVTTFFLNDKIDCGAIIMQQEVEILPSDNLENLYNRLMDVGAKLVTQTVDAIDKGEVKPIVQNQNETLYRPAPKIFKEDCELSFDKSVIDIHNKIRGLSPYPAAWCCVSGARSIENTVKEDVVAKIVTSHFEHDIQNEAQNIEVGVWQTDSKSYLRVRGTDGWLYVDELQPQNKKRMATIDFIRGWR